jgi:outer membrane protein assembly factor BamB
LIAEGEASLFGFFESGTVFSVESDNGNPNSKMTFSEKISAAIFADGKIAVSFAGKQLLVFMPKDFSSLDRLKTTEEPVEFTLVRNGLVVVGDRSGNLSAYDLKSKSRKWHAKTGGAISAIIEIESGFLVSSVDNFVYLFSRSGNRIWKRRLAGRTFGRPALSSDSAAFATLDGDTGYVLELKKGRITDALFLEEGNSFVANPVFAAGVFVFPTNRGLVTYGSGKCGGK